MEDKHLADISKKLNVLIALSIRALKGHQDLVSQGRKLGAGEIIHFLGSMGIEATDIAKIIGSPLPSVRTLLTPKMRRRQSKPKLRKTR
jgi:hypothetical protein